MRNRGSNKTISYAFNEDLDKIVVRDEKTGRGVNQSRCITEESKGLTYRFTLIRDVAGVEESSWT